MTKYSSFCLFSFFLFLPYSPALLRAEAQKPSLTHLSDASSLLEELPINYALTGVSTLSQHYTKEEVLLMPLIRYYSRTSEKIDVDALFRQARNHPTPPPAGE